MKQTLIEEKIDEAITLLCAASKDVPASHPYSHEASLALIKAVSLAAEASDYLTLDHE